MPPSHAEQFADEDSAIEFYDARYDSGYMGGQRRTKLARAAEMLESLALPDGARVFDFGCGIGEFTGHFTKTFPALDISGGDVSRVAIEKARTKYPHIEFKTLAPEENINEKSEYDLVFSNHVLEHVLEIDKTAARMANLVKVDGYMIHILPCVNSGNFLPDVVVHNRFHS